ncbi:MAG: DUF1816 domain-containing protein [Leptolyngbyaceae cyanobacterium]
MKNIFSQLFGSLFKSDEKWWLEVKTTGPNCTYYFGPFEIEQEANLAKKGYIDDLEQEGSKVLTATVMSLSAAPQQLTVYDEGLDDTAPSPAPVYSGQS